MSREEQNEEKRRLILMTALKLFVRKGYAGTKTKEITEQAGISEGLLFHYFRSKEELLLALVELGVSGQQFALELKFQTPIEFFCDFTRLLFQYLKENPVISNMFVLMAQIQRMDGIPERAVSLAKTVDNMGMTVELIKEGQVMGCIKNGDPMGLANAYWCSIQGIAEQYALNPYLILPDPDCIVAIVKGEGKDEK